MNLFERLPNLVLIAKANNGVEKVMAVKEHQFVSVAGRQPLCHLRERLYEFLTPFWLKTTTGGPNLLIKPQNLIKFELPRTSHQYEGPA